MADPACVLCGLAEVVERAFTSHFPGDALYRTAANTTLSSNLQNALPGPQLALDSLFQGGIDSRPPKLPARFHGPLKARADFSGGSCCARTPQRRP